MSISVLYCWLYIQFIQFDLSTTYGFWKQKTRNSNEMPVYIQTFYSLCILASLDLWIWFFCVANARPHSWLCFQDWKFIRDLHQHTYYCSGRHSVYVMHKHFYKLFRACTLGMVLWNGILDACIREQRKKKKRDYLGQGNGWKTRILLTK